MAEKVFRSMDGNEAASYISYAFTEVATIYPITPSSPMAAHVDEWSAHGMKNIFGSRVKLMEYLGPPECYEEAGKTIGERISHLPMAKAVGIYSAGLSTNFHKFVSCLSGGNPEVPFFGATAGMFEFSAEKESGRKISMSLQPEKAA